MKRIVIAQVCDATKAEYRDKVGNIILIENKKQNEFCKRYNYKLQTINS